MAACLFAQSDGRGHRRLPLVSPWAVKARSIGRAFGSALVSPSFFVWLGIRQFRKMEKSFRRPNLIMSDVVISVENLSKRYLVGHRSGERESYTALRDVIGS